MFEKEIEFIYNYYLNKIEKLNSFVTFDQLASANLHPALLQYVSAEIDYLIFEDRQKLLKESLFDYSGDQINDHFNQISEEIKLTKKFSKEYISKLLLHATSFNVNYVVRPNWSLLQFIFENEEEKHVHEVKQILNYLYYYPYYKRILINYFNQKHLYKISEDEMVNILDKIDKINFENNFEEIVGESLSNIVDFINIGEVGNTKIAKGIIELFLADKNIAEPSKILKEKLAGSSDDKFKIEDYKEIIMSLQDAEDEQVDQAYDEGDQFEEAGAEVKEDLSTEEKISNDENEIDQDSVEGNSKIKDEAQLDIEELPEVKSDEIIETEPDELAETDEFELPEFDEGPRVGDTDLQDVYNMVVEEEEIENVELDDDSNEGERVNISDDEAVDSYLKELDEFDENIETSQEVNTKEVGESESRNDDDYVIQGTSVSFSADELEDHGTSDSVEIIEAPNDQKSLDSIENTDESESPMVESINKTNDEEKVPVIEESKQEDLDIEETDESEFQNIKIEEASESEIPELQTVRRNIDVSELLKNKKITKIIENVFDYDMEEFTKTIDNISECSSEGEALLIIDKIAHGSFLDESSREIKNFKKIISDLF